PQGNKLWSGVTAGAEKGVGEKGRDAGQAAGGGRGAIDEKAAKGELSPTTNVTQPDVKESDTALASSNLIAKGSSSERANNNRTAPPINANNKPGNLPADKNSNLAANTPGGNTVNTSKHPYVKDSKAKPGGISGGGSAGKAAPGSVIKATQPSGGNTDAGKTKSGTAAGTGPIPREVTSAGKAKRGLMKSKQASGDVTKEGKAKPGSVIKTDVSGEETTAGKNKPGLAKATESSHPDNANKAQSTIIPIPATPSHTNRQGKTPVTLKNATGTPNTVVLQPLRTVNAFSIHLPTLPLNHREQQISFLTGGFRDPVNYDGPITGGLALQAGFVYPLSVGVAAGDSGTAKPGNGLGFKLGATYAFPIARGLYLQPILSAAYLGGFGKAFSHTAVNRKQETDSLGAATGVFRTDTTTTPYTVKSTFVGGAGVNVAYVINKWIFSTGLTYQYALPSGAKGTPETHTHTDSLQSVPASSTPAFSKQQLPGTHTLSWSLDAGYYIRPRIQVGISYRAILLRSAGNSGFAKPLQPLQDKQLELYIRVPLRK
ncbi:MAG TPA: hypothetical protein VIM87_25860, partial [Chitinophaga sp.]|uniref:hypothetical protein n=1 Tax=Chitinophaga sp. TaxID=1869181 RepID=UPI002F95AE43